MKTINSSATDDDFGSAKAIVFFDGVCVLCNKWIDFLIKKDRYKNLRYATLQGTSSEKLLPKSGRNLESITVYETNSRLVSRKSVAIFRILKLLPFPMNVLGITAGLVPRFISDYFYDLIAESRYSLFGKENHCRIPNREERELILP